MPENYVTVKSPNGTGRYQQITELKSVDPKTGSAAIKKTVVSFAADGTKIRNDYYAAAEARDLAKMNGYEKYYKTEIIQENGKFYVKVTVKKEQPVGFLAEDYLKVVNDGTLKENNPKYFEGIHEEYGNGKTASDLNHTMKPGESLRIPAEKVDIKSSTVGWFRRNIMHTMY